MTEQFNRYRPPAAEVQDVGSARGRERAGRGRRLGTFLVDYVGHFLVSFLAGFLLSTAIGPASKTLFTFKLNFVLGGLVVFAYYLFFEGIWARTPGKWIFGTAVVNEAGDRPSFGQILARTACRFIPLEPFSFFGEVGWHDSIPRTRVVRVSRET